MNHYIYNEIIITSNIDYYRLESSFTSSAGASGNTASSYGLQCSTNHFLKNSLSTLSGSCISYHISSRKYISFRCIIILYLLYYDRLYIILYYI